MRRTMLLGMLVLALCGCGVAVPKLEPSEEKTVAPTPVAPEVYDKVAPMPREVKAPPKPGSAGNDLNKD